jgi:DNA-binding CsgD family transcriptional regulator
MNRTKAMILAALGLYLALYVVEKLQSGEGFQLGPVIFDLFEMGLLMGAVWMTAMVATETRALRDERDVLLRGLDRARAEGDGWRKTALGQIEGLSRSIRRQFDDWGLTEAEADVAGLMLKGLSHKEIAHLRDGSEATVRQHAAAVYRKSGLASRSQLAAFFLEDLLAPRPVTGASTVQAEPRWDA